MPEVCPKCGMIINAVEGRSKAEVLCEHCGQPVDLLEAISKQTAVKRELPPTFSGKNGFRLVHILAIAFIICIVIGLSLPVPMSRESPHRMQCENNFHQLVIALLAYENKNHHFPPAYIPDKNGKPLHSWRVLILPYLDRKDLFEQYDFSEPWNGRHNRLLADKMPTIFGCPSNHDSPNCTGYAMLVGPHAFSPGPTGRTLGEISAADGTSATLMLVEAADAKINWLEPRDLNIEEMTFHVGKDGKELSGHHAGGVVVSFCDGHQSVIRPDIKPEMLKALTTVDGGEPVDENSL
jgi:hypothetical protein